MPTTVVNIRDAEFDEYIGRQVTRRSSRGRLHLNRSPFANPFPIGTGLSREQSIHLFTGWLYARPDLMRRARLELAGKRLACWCHPQPCHGDVLAAIVDLTQLEFDMLLQVIDATRSKPQAAHPADALCDTGDERAAIDRLIELRLIHAVPELMPRMIYRAYVEHSATRSH